MPRRPPRFLVQCPRCGARQYRGSWGRNIACGACCDRYNQGRFSPEFVLTLVERKNDEQTPPAPRHNVSLLSRPRQRLVIPAQLSLFGEEQAV